MIFIRIFKLGIMSQFRDTRVDMGVGGLKAFAIKEGFRLRIALPFKSLTTLVVG